MRRLVIVNRPNNNFYRIRSRGQYGNRLYADLIEELKEYDVSIGSEVEAFRNNGERALIDYFQGLYFEAKKSGCEIPLVLNPGAFTHYSYAIKDALEPVHTLTPAIEVHISSIHGRGDFRHISVTASECLGQITGMGKHSYKIAMEAFKQTIEEGQL